MREDLTVVKESPAEPSGLEDLSAHLEVAAVQAGQPDGIEVVLGVANGGASSASLLNPFDNVQFQLLDEAGFPVPLPSRPSGLRAVTRGNDPWRFVPPFPVVAVHLNGEVVDLGAIEARVLTLDAGDEYEATFRIDRAVEGQPGQAGVTGGPGDEPLASGVYAVRCVATLIRADEPRDARILQSPRLEVRFERSR
jgi:hypothetical protein